MGLRLDLPKEKNGLYHDFTDAYWAIDNVFHSPDMITFGLKAYPSREAKLMNGKQLENPSIGYGSGPEYVRSALYTWNVQIALTDVFPDGTIPAGRDAQYTAIYNWIKDYMGLPFEDVLEEE